MKNSLLLFLGSALLAAVPVVHAADKDVTTPIFSSNAKKLAYCVVTFTETDGKDGEKKYAISASEIWTANSDGSGARRVTTGAMDGNIRWSPDDKQLAFMRKGDIWMVGTDGAGLQQITKTPAIEESAPEFSNDGKTLFFIRTQFENLARFTPGAAPIIDKLPGVVIARSLVSGEEKERFKSKDSMIQVVPNRADPGEVFLLYNVDDNPTEPNYVVAAAKLDGSARRILKEDSKSEIQGIHAHVGGTVIETKELSPELETLHKLTIHSKAGNKTLDADDFPLMVFNAISLDGNSVVGSGPVTRKVNGKFEVEQGLKIYEPATKKTTALNRAPLLATDVPTATTTPVAVVPPPTRPAALASPPAQIPVPPQTTKALGAPPAAAKAHFEEGSKNFKRGVLGVAVDEFSKAIALYPDYLDAHRQLAKAYSYRFEWDNSIKNMSAVVRLTPNDSEAYYERGDYSLMGGHYAAAESDYNSAIKLAPNNPELYRARANLLRKMGGDAQKRQAEADEKKAKELEG